MSTDRVHPETRVRQSRRTEAELVEAIREDERQQGRTMTTNERIGFARGFFGTEYAGEIRMLARAGLLDDEDEGA
jgi:hypothetical protein